MKKIICLILLTIIMISVLAITVYANDEDYCCNLPPVSLRAGGGSSGGGGGSSGGSSGDRKSVV